MNYFSTAPGFSNFISYLHIWPLNHGLHLYALGCTNLFSCGIGWNYKVSLYSSNSIPSLSDSDAVPFTPLNGILSNPVIAILIIAYSIWKWKCARSHHTPHQVTPEVAHTVVWGSGNETRDPCSLGCEPRLCPLYQSQPILLEIQIRKSMSSTPPSQTALKSELGIPLSHSHILGMRLDIPVLMAMGIVTPAQPFWPCNTYAQKLYWQELL